MKSKFESIIKFFGIVSTKYERTKNLRMFLYHLPLLIEMSGKH